MFEIKLEVRESELRELDKWKSCQTVDGFERYLAENVVGVVSLESPR